MNPRVEISGGPSEHEAVAIAAAIQVLLAEAEAKARRPTTTSRWKVDLEEFTPGTWGVSRPAGAPSGDPDD